MDTWTHLSSRSTRCVFYFFSLPFFSVIWCQIDYLCSKMFSEFSKFLLQLQRAFKLKTHLVILEHPWSSISDNNHLNLKKTRWLLCLLTIRENCGMYCLLALLSYLCLINPVVHMVLSNFYLVTRCYGVRMHTMPPNVLLSTGILASLTMASATKVFLEAPILVFWIVDLEHECEVITSSGFQGKWNSASQSHQHGWRPGLFNSISGRARMKK